ncbi:MAG TPA: hypothetical protein VGP93_04255 [Polyangiaceae bacterium]|jgi:hypothetical protein|nr:hypothetical protein [Polyangiaceae bacterium]
MRSRAFAQSCFGACLTVASLGCSASPDDAGQDGTGAGTSAGGGGSGGASTVGGTTGTGGSAASGGVPGGGSAGTPASGGTSASGGSTNGGGSGGSGPAHVVGTCEGLGAVDEWQFITPSQVDAGSEYGVTQVLTDPIHAGTVYVGTDKRGVFKSTDCGATWTKIDTGNYANVIDSGIEWEMEIDPVNPDLLFAGSLYGGDPSLLRSTNAGVDWASLWPEGSNVASTVEYNFLQELSVDPTDHEHLVVSFHAPCKGDYAPMCMGESNDSGATWRLFKGPASGWVENSRPLVLGATTWLYATWADGLFYTSDSGESWENVGAGGGSFYQRQDGTYFLANYQAIFQSSDGHVWTKIEGSPGGAAIKGDGQRMFTSAYYCCNSKQPFFVSTESDGTAWTTLPSPTLDHGASSLAIDADHHILYAAVTAGGLLRMVTQ